MCAGLFEPKNYLQSTLIVATILDNAQAQVEV
jgi:hypothetical protein